MAEQIEQIQKQTFRYYYEDGLIELAIGILFTVLGFNAWLISSAPRGTLLVTIAWISLPILTIGGIYGVGRFVKNLKEKYVHPRTGYIEYSAKPNRYRWLITGVGLALIVAIIVLDYEWLQKGSFSAGTILFVILVSVGIQVGLKRLIAVGALSMILGLIFSLTPMTDNASLAATFAAVGPILILIGVLAWRKYLAENPLLEEGVND